jgi:anti-anti-sigma factor
MTGEQATVDRRENDGAAVVTVRGEVDMSNADVVGRQIRAGGGLAGAVTLDLSDIQFFDSSGLYMLHRLHSEIEEAGGELTVVTPSGTIVGRLLTLTHLDTYLRVRESL